MYEEWDPIISGTPNMEAKAGSSSLQSFQDLKQGQGVEVYSHSRTSNKCSLFKVTYSAVVPGGVPKLMARNSHPISENDKVYTVVLKHNHI